MNRRQGLYLAAGLAAAAAGAGWQLRKSRAVTGAAGDMAPESLWTLRFTRPEGDLIALADLRGRPLLINFWATWCPPCVKEMPLLSSFHQRFNARGQVLGLAVDGPTPVREFLKRTPVGFPIGLAGFDGTELSKQLGNLEGGLPFTVLVDAQGRIVQRKLGETNAEQLDAWARAL